MEKIERQEEFENSSLWLERKSFRIALISTFTALTVVLGYMLVFLPNIEMVAMMIFLSGFILGKKDGMIVGLMASFIFCFFNPIGTSPLPLLMLQLVFYSALGLLGGITCDFLSKRKFFKPEEDLYVFPVILLFGIIAVITTFTYDVLSTVVLALSVFGTLDAFLPNYILGIPFTVVHLIGNTLIFIFILPGLIQLIYKMLDITKD